MDEDPVSLSHEELVVLAGLVRATIEADDRIDPAEVRAVQRIAAAVTEAADHAPLGAYRTAAYVTPLDEAAWSAIWREAVERLPSIDDVKRAAKAVGRAEAREALYALVHDVAAADTIAGAEWSLLGWLEEAWSLSTTRGSES